MYSLRGRNIETNVKCFSSEACGRLMPCLCVWGPLGACLRVCVSVLRWRFGSGEIKCIHLHLQAGVSRATCWNSNALLPPWDSDHRSNAENWARHAARFSPLSLSLSSFICLSLILHSARHLSLLSHMYKCLPLLFQSGSASLWHLTNSVTNNTIHPAHCEWWCSHRWLLLVERLSDLHEHTVMHVLHAYKPLFPVSKVEPLLTLD